MFAVLRNSAIEALRLSAQSEFSTASAHIKLTLINLRISSPQVFVLLKTLSEIDDKAEICSFKTSFFTFVFFEYSFAFTVIFKRQKESEAISSLSIGGRKSLASLLQISSNSFRDESTPDLPSKAKNANSH
ncbi:MAG: hypothetical protein IJ264_02730 [Clostridia bacterium]|nr:hypothetical protein [Clostridia bacterium]